MNRAMVALSRIFVLSLGVCFGSGGCVETSAQVGFDASAAANEVTEFNGTLKGVRGLIIQVTRDDGTEVMIQAPDTPPQIVYSAKALPAYLQRGMMVRFDTMIGPQGQPMAPVDKLVLFAPVNVNLIPGHARTDYTPGVHPADPNVRVAPGQPMMGKATVVGSLMMITPQGGLMVQAGRTPVQAMVSPNVALELRVNNLSLAQEGDPVSVAGFYQPPDDTKVKADRITIQSPRVYGEAPEKPVRRVRGSKTAPRKDAPAEAAPAEEAAAQVDKL